MPAADDEVSIRILPHGELFSAVVQFHQDLTLKLTLDAAELPPFRTGNLVEIHTPDSIYLGEVQQAVDHLVEVHIEHSLNLHELDAIQAHWNRPAGFF